MNELNTIKQQETDLLQTPEPSGLDDATRRFRNTYLPTFLDPPQLLDEIGRLAGYRILEVLGRGGMGIVFKAEDLALKRMVALKVMLPEVAADPGSRARFLREARAQAAVEHDHIVPIFSVVENTSSPFLTMPLLTGQSLASVIKRSQKLPLSEIARIGWEVAEGLAAAHAQGLVHRDIKPANIWLESRNRRVRILDFGLACGPSVNSGEKPITISGVVMGTPGYMSPEQAAGKPVDFRADLFSFGVLLYQMATGEMPFHGTDVYSLLTSLLIEVPLPPIERNAELPVELSQCIERCLAKNPDERPGSMQEVAEILKPLASPVTQPMTIAPMERNPFHDLAPSEAMTSEVRTENLTPRKAIPIWLWTAFSLAVVGIAGGVLGKLIMAAGPPGTLYVERDVATKDLDLVLKSRGRPEIHLKGRELQLPPGDYTIEPAEKRPGLKLSAREIRIPVRGSATVRVSLESTKPTVKPADVNLVKRPPIEIHEVHGVTPYALETWAKNLPEGYRPTWISVRAGSESPLLDAVAERAPDNAEWELQVIYGDPAPKFAEMSKTHRPVQMLTFSADPPAYIRLWVKDSKPWKWWYGNADYVAKSLMDEKAAMKRPYLMSLFKSTCCHTYDICYSDHFIADFEWHFKITMEDLIAEIENCKKRGWRPHIMYVHGNVMPPSFLLVTSENEPFLNWDFTPSLTVSQYEAALKDYASRGYRPQCVASTEVNGQVTYTVIWSTQEEKDSPPGPPDGRPFPPRHHPPFGPPPPFPPPPHPPGSLKRTS